MAGEVTAAGSGVRGWDPGAPVAVEPLVTCRECPTCLRGDYQICPRRLLLGIGRDGGLAEFVRVPAYTLFALPPDLPAPVGALAEPAAVAVHAVRLAGIAPGERVLVQGSGTIGLLCALVAREAGAQVSATARYPHQAAAATQFGARRVFTADEPGGKELAALTTAEPFDVVIEAVGGEADTLVQAPSLVGPGGRVCVTGVFFAPPKLGALSLIGREVRMIGAVTYGREGGIDGVADFTRAIALLDTHRALVGSLVTYRRPLEQVSEAFALADDKVSKALKVTIEP
jgi:threonine dehydrogenase-like Zn-dependent dehydrogenase